MGLMFMLMFMLMFDPCLMDTSSSVLVWKGSGCGGAPQGLLGLSSATRGLAGVSCKGNHCLASDRIQ